MEKVEKQVFKEHFKINRAIWRSGSEGSNATGEGVTALLNKKGSMCCLGQICNQKGIEKTSLVGWGEPGDLDKYVPYLNYEGGGEYYKGGDEYYVSSSLSNSAIEINDDAKLTKKEREEKLIALFKADNIKLTFYGRAKKYKEDSR